MISEFAKEKVFWTRKMNLKLVKFIENKPHVWNKNHPKYTSLQMKDQTYAEFAAQYGNQFSGQAVKDRWINIRTTFSRHLRKIRSSGEDNKEYKFKWHLWEACQFLRNAKKCDEANVDPLPFDCDDSELIDSDYKDELSPKPDEIYENSNNDQTNDSLSCNNFANQLLQVFKGVQNDAFGLNQSKHGKIAKATVKKLRSLDSFEAAKLTQEIGQILLLYDRNNPDNPNNNKLCNTD